MCQKPVSTLHLSNYNIFCYLLACQSATHGPFQLLAGQLATSRPVSYLQASQLLAGQSATSRPVSYLQASQLLAGQSATCRPVSYLRAFSATHGPFQLLVGQSASHLWVNQLQAGKSATRGKVSYSPVRLRHQLIWYCSITIAHTSRPHAHTLLK